MPANQSDRSEWSYPNRFTPVGSAAYYALRFSPAATRQRDALLFAWHELIMQVSAQPFDPGAARLKLDWWRQEISAIRGGTARHPLALQLQRSNLGDNPEPLMHAVIEVADAELHRTGPLHADAFVAACRNSLGNVFRLAANAEADTDACLDLGGYCTAVERIRCQASCAQRVPEELRQLPQGDSAHRVTLIDALLERFDAMDRGGGGSVPDFGRRLTALARAMQCKMQRQGYPASGPPIERAPIAHLWTAWRRS